ncbi:MAG: flavin reductase family protein [Lachnospiraceae bacterium]|nr:flavin reductase family protein [Lachnospiraceae bacterium]
MEKLTIGQAEKLTSPNPFAILTVAAPSGETNVMAISWWNYASNHPATVTACLSKKGFSGSCIAESGHFGLSIVGEGLEEAAFRAGTCSGRSGGKAELLGLPLTDEMNAPQKMVAGSRLWLACKLVNTLDVGDHVLYVGEVEDIMGDASVKGLYAMDGYARLSVVE